MLKQGTAHLDASYWPFIWQFFVYTDHKPLTYAFNAKPDRHSPRKIRQLDFRSQFTTDLRYVKGQNNVVADTLSRPDISALHTESRIGAQETDSELKALLKSETKTSMVLKKVPRLIIGGSNVCDVSHRLGSARYIHVLSLLVIRQLVLMMMRSQAIFAYMSPVTFDLLTPKSNQFIGSARYIHDPSLAGIHQSVLEITRARERGIRTTYFVAKA